MNENPIKNVIFKAFSRLLFYFVNIFAYNFTIELKLKLKHATIDNCKFVSK